MKVLHLSTFDISGGASRAAYRLHQRLRDIGIASQMLVQAKDSDDRTVLDPHNKLERGFSKLRPAMSRLPLQLYPQRELTEYSPAWLPDAITSRVKQLTPDVINLHWISGGYLQIKTLANFSKPIVWTLHDMWAFTGGCHYSQNCDRYTNTCGACPQLHSHQSQDLSRWQWQRKARTWKELHLTLVAPSRWLARCAQASSLFKDVRVEVISNGLDTSIYKPISRNLARKLLNLPQDKQLIVFGAMRATSDSRKGFHLLQPALQSLSQSGWQEQVEIAIFGSSQPETQIDTGFKSHYLGRLHDDISLAIVYSAADVTIVPSTQEAFGLTASESLACGTPVVAFNATGLQDIVEHQQNGYLAQPYQIEDLSRGIAWVLENKERYRKLCDRAREKIEQEFTLELQARRYAALFEDLLSSRSG